MFCVSWSCLSAGRLSEERLKEQLVVAEKESEKSKRECTALQEQLRKMEETSKVSIIERFTK